MMDEWIKSRRLLSSLYQGDLLKYIDNKTVKAPMTYGGAIEVLEK